MKQIEKALRRPITGILISIVMGFIVGAVVLTIAGYSPLAAYREISAKHPPVEIFETSLASGELPPLKG